MQRIYNKLFSIEILSKVVSYYENVRTRRAVDVAAADGAAAVCAGARLVAQVQVNVVQHEDTHPRSVSLSVTLSHGDLEFKNSVLIVECTASVTTIIQTCSLLYIQ